MPFAAPLVPLYLVRVVGASDGWISIINTSQTAILVIGYFLWTRFGKKKGTRKLLLWTTLGVSFYPFLMALTTSTWQIAIFAGIAGIFQAGLNLVFFDVLMQTVPPEYSALFVGIAQSMQFMAMIISPVLATLIADTWSVGSRVIRFCCHPVHRVSSILIEQGTNTGKCSSNIMVSLIA